MSKPIAVLLGVAVLVVSSAAMAKVTPEEAAKLGKELTPVGAEKAANKDGTIPAWTPIAQSGPLTGLYASDPEVDKDKPLYTITKANMAQYTGMLAEGYKKLLAQYPTYKMNVYPSHRKVTFPETIMKETIANATRAEMVGTDDPIGASVGFPFPIPKTGAEPIWNHKLRWRGEAVQRYNNQMIVQPSGEFQLTKIIEDVSFSYASIKKPVPLSKDNKEFLKYLSHTVAPPRLAGTYILVLEKASVGNEGRAAWLYSPGLKRIRRAPTVCCDNPYEGTDGHQFYDQVDMFNGALDRYNWKLLGKKEMIVSYESNKLGAPQTRFRDMVKPHHLNQDLPRYEPHRMWIVEATLKPGTSHTFKKRVMALDEDSWDILTVDDYDNRDQLFQFQEGHIVIGSNILSASTVPEVIYHFDSGRYFITAMSNEDKPNNFTISYSPDYYTAASVQKNTTK